MHRSLFRFGLALVALGCASAEAYATAISFEATDNATVQPAGPRAGTSGKNFFNMEGSNNGNFSSFGVAEFDFASISYGGSAVGVSNVSLQMTQSNAGFSTAGPMSFYLTTQNGVDIQPANTSLNYVSGNNGAASVDSDLAPLAILGSGNYTVVSSGTVDSFPLTFGGTELLDALNTGGKLRIVITPDDPATAATYAGFSNSTLAGPTLTMDVVVPEPATIGVVGLATLALLRRRAV